MRRAGFMADGRFRYYRDRIYRVVSITFAGFCVAAAIWACSAAYNVSAEEGAEPTKIVDPEPLVIAPRKPVSTRSPAPIAEPIQCRPVSLQESLAVDCKLRVQPNTQRDAIQSLNQGEGVSANCVTNDGWHRVRTSAGSEGWVGPRCWYRLKETTTECVLREENADLLHFQSKTVRVGRGKDVYLLGDRGVGAEDAEILVGLRDWSHVGWMHASCVEPIEVETVTDPGEYRMEGVIEDSNDGFDEEHDGCAVEPQVEDRHVAGSMMKAKAADIALAPPGESGQGGGCAWSGVIYGTCWESLCGEMAGWQSFCAA